MREFSLKDIIQYLEQSDRFLITAHESPDGDALGAAYALGAALMDMKKDIYILTPDPPAEKYLFIDQRSLFHGYRNKKNIPKDMADRNLLILDTEPSNIGSLTDILPKRAKSTIVIDHHELKKNLDYEGWLVPTASSTCELIFLILEAMNHPLSLDIATALYAGIIYDTGSFIYPGTTALTFRIGKELVSKGVIPNEVYTQLFENKTTGALILQSLVTSTMILYLNNRVAFQTMPRETLIASGAEYEEAQEIVKIPLQCATVRVSAFFKESTDGQKRCSLRSKGEADCSAIAQSFGGGGHKRAAGFRFDGAFNEIQKQVLEALTPYFS